MPVPRRYSSATAIALTVAFIAIGFLAGRTRSNDATQPAARSTIPRETAAAMPAPSASTQSDAATSEIPPSVEKPNPKGTWEARWSQLLAQPARTERDRDLAKALRELAHTDPERALRLAREQKSWRLQDLLREAALRGWAEKKPDDAASWALAQPEHDRAAVIAAVLEGAARDPDKAVETALRICNDDTTHAGDHGQAAVAALADAGAFEHAVTFAEQMGADQYGFLLGSAYFAWARNDPQQALDSFATIRNPSVQEQIFKQLARGWALADARGLAEHAVKLPSGTRRAEALALALPQWIESDPSAALEWINRFDSGPEFDAAAVAAANRQAVITQQPQIAMEWASSISDSVTRAHTLQAVFAQWLQNDRNAAMSFLSTVNDSETRALLSAETSDRVSTTR